MEVPDARTAVVTLTRDAPLTGAIVVTVGGVVSATEPPSPIITTNSFVAVAPVIVLFVVLQRQFMSGLTSGALKG